MTPHQIAALHTYSREVEMNMRARGAVFDKAMLRHNDTVAVGLHWSRIGPVTRCTMGIAKAGVQEAVRYCVKAWRDGDVTTPCPEYVPGFGPKQLIQPWMETT